jgi:hypothetical protein
MTDRANSRSSGRLLPFLAAALVLSCGPEAPGPGPYGQSPGSSENNGIVVAGAQNCVPDVAAETDTVVISGGKATPGCLKVLPGTAVRIQNRDALDYLFRGGFGGSGALDVPAGGEAFTPPARAVIGAQQWDCALAPGALIVIWSK